MKSQKDRNHKELAKVQKRIDELDGLFRKMYEDNFNHKLSDERYFKMSRQFENEQDELLKRTAELKTSISEMDSQQDNTDKFIKIVNKYTHIEKLDATILNELIEKIVVYDAVMDGEQKTQKIDIHYNFVGVFQRWNGPNMEISVCPYRKATVV